MHYCAEAFANDGSLAAALLKTIKRTMAAEYSRELSTKVFAGQSRLTELGFRQGGTAGYGFRRLLVNQDGKPKFVLHGGERKSIATDRIILILSRQYVADRRGTQEIARMLNKRGMGILRPAVTERRTRRVRPANQIQLPSQGQLNVRRM